MKITIVCAGKLKEKYLTAGIAEYQKRLAPFTQFEIREAYLRFFAMREGSMRRAPER